MSTAVTSRPTAPADDASHRAEKVPELVCPAGSFPALKAAVENGADCVYVGLRDDTNARNFAALNLCEAAARNALSHAHAAGVKVLLAVNTYPQPGGAERWRRAVDFAADAGFDAVLLADAGLMRYCADRHPSLAIHLSVQASATSYEAINFYRRRFGVSRAVLPRVLSVSQVESVARNTEVEIEVFGFGSLCVMVEGRCALSSYVTGDSPNTRGVCSPAKAVRWEAGPQGLEVRLNGVALDRYAPGESAGYPTLCKGRFSVNQETYYAIEEPSSLNALALLPELMRIGVAAIKIEGRQRSPAYVAEVTRVWREAIDECARNPSRFSVRSGWTGALARLSEGQQHTLGAYHRRWK